MSDEQLNALLAAVNGIDKILLLPHNDPDPDAVASVMALRYLLAEKAKIDSFIVYRGFIGRAENKVLVNYLGFPLQSSPTPATPQPIPVALVDTQPGAGNNALSADTTAAIVIDHHPWREATALATFADIRTDAGATSTILTEYLQTAGLEPDRQLATALFYGIKTDTMGLSREAGSADTAAYLYLQPRVDFDALIEIEYAQVPGDYFKSFDSALHSARIYDSVIVTYVGLMAYPDLAAETADLFLRLEGCEWVICIGVFENELILSVRTRNRQGGAGRLAQTVVGRHGTAGGHGSMGGGNIPLNGREPKRLSTEIRRRALQYLNIGPENKGQLLI